MDRIIHIQWTGPFSYRTVPSINDPRTDYGLYQVYACHPVYGSGVLVYIGLAAHQTFGVRIPQRRWEIGSEPDPERLEFYAGRLSGEPPESRDIWADEIRLAEKLFDPRTRTLNSSPPTSATRTRAGTRRGKLSAES
jgi:hypothetical protein